MYAANMPGERKQLWDQLPVVSRTIDQPWLLAGDFSTICSAPEVSNSDDFHSGDVKDFKQLLLHLELQDINTIRNFFTWSHRRLVGYVERKLDRTLESEAWFSLFLLLLLIFLAAGVSNHCPALITLVPDDFKPPRPFKFFNLQSKHSNYLQTVEGAWQAEKTSSPMFLLYEKLSNTKKAVRKFGKVIVRRL
ncbi:hypothetical protein NL676_030878 [Syzygium grande]|nr:hypothetical protein NL676_030878 [Syzygium grande]